MANEDADVVQPKSKKGLVIAIVVIINVAALAGGAYFLMNKDDAVNEANPNAPARSSRTGRNISTDGPIIELDGFVVNLTNAREKRYLKTKMSVQLYSADDQPEFEKYLSIVRNEILLQLSAIELEKVQSIEGKRDLEKMLVQKVNERLDMDRIAAIYLTEFVTQ
ncbi:MAG: flagellar basal body-associated FliL family protein [Deltaproteobacteria bacterium]|nr:flagellar basal body-associated FliL family protein [Deltaproteobacteria bacterium]